MNELLGWYGYDKLELRDSEATEIRNYPNRERRQQHVSVLKGEGRPGPCSLGHTVVKRFAMESGNLCFNWTSSGSTSFFKTIPAY